jgi:Cys-tRNA(Pro) deacylase
MAKEKSAITAAIRVLREQNLTFAERPYRYEDRGGTAVSARELGIDEHAVIKTLIMEDDAKNPLIVLMHGDKEVSTKELARILGTKKVTPVSPETAHRLTGYTVGGISPFGTRKELPVYVEETILDLPKIVINGGKRGLLVEVDPRDVIGILKPFLVKVAV